MRFFEIILVLLIFFLPMLFIWKPRFVQISRPFAFASLLAALILQMVVDGYRLQMVPAYAAAIVMILILCITWRKPQRAESSRRGWKATLWTIVVLISFGVMAAPPMLMPVFAFENPTGPYQVGTTVLHWTDFGRKDENASDSNAHRELMVQLWYPAATTDSMQIEPYIRHVKAVTQGLESALSFPSWTLEHLSLVQSHAYKDAPLSDVENRYPVLIFSHGMTGFRNQNTFQVEELASHGYIVVGIDHAYDAAATVYPDGREILMKKSNLSGFGDFDRHMPLWVGDVTFVLNQLQNLNNNGYKGKFKDRLDLTRTGMFGHSYGGAAAAQMLLKDSRILAAINMDGTLYGGPPPESGMTKPYLQMNGEQSIDKSVFERSLDKAIARSGKSRGSYEAFWDETVRRRNLALQSGGYTMTIPNTSHMSFTDFHLFSPLLSGKKEQPREVHRIINEVSLAFFDQYVKGKGHSEMNEVSKKYPQIHLIQPNHERNASNL
ncbi:alpha/beta hydrolase family protein [Paenibacillus azoreducens]|uniref:alpha/beta hydrolase family protein n=1 Tax=Paenibacillus azoreducens TaxID=116718 RepID=UPI0039F4686D